MGKVYSGIEGIKEPKVSLEWEKYDKECEDYVAKIKQWAKDNGTCPEAGEEIYFGVADGRARYVVLSLKPVELVHLNVMDGYQYPYVHRLTAKDVRGELKRCEALRKLFRK